MTDKLPDIAEIEVEHNGQIYRIKGCKITRVSDSAMVELPHDELVLETVTIQFEPQTEHN